MHRPLSKTFASFVAVPECQSARRALERMDACLALEQAPEFNPLYLFGPAGSGKTHLCEALIESATRRQAQLTVAVLSAADWRAGQEGEPHASPLEDVADVDLLVLEDLQHLPARRAEAVLRDIDTLLAHGGSLVVTAICGPQHLELPARLVSRLAGGLVVGIEPLQQASRLLLLQELTRRRRLAVKPATVQWLAQRLNGARQIEGTLARLEMLARNRPQPLEVADITDSFREDTDSARLTMERIVAGVASFFSIDPKQLRARQRRRSAMVPRQVSMYLARQLTELPLQQIGAYFGGRDHSTVLHACRKIEESLTRDAVLSGTVRHLSASLT